MYSHFVGGIYPRQAEGGDDVDLTPEKWTFEK